MPSAYSANPKLGRWVSKERTQYRLYQGGHPNSTTRERIRALNGITFDWGTSQTELVSIWSVRFQQLSEFKAQIGHCLVSNKYAANPKLGQWVLNQRSKYRLQQKGKPSPMTEERIRALNGIGFGWATCKTDLVPWSVRFQQLSEFKAQIGHCLVPIKYSKYPKLGTWVSDQRSNRRSHQDGKPSPMTEERIRVLNGISFDWGTSKNDLVPWSVRFQQLSEFKAQFGHCLVPIKYSANPDLGRWVSVQRSKCRLQQKGKPSPMTGERIRELESVGFNWGQARLIGHPI